MITKQFTDVNGTVRRGPVFAEGPKGIVIGREYFYIYLIDQATGRYTLHSHGYSAGWIDYFRTMIGS